MKRWPLIRHILWAYYKWQFEEQWMVMKHIWLTPNPSDLQFLEDVWNGKQ